MALQDDHEVERERKPFLEHLADLRTMIIRSAVFLVVGMLVAVPLAPWALAALKSPLVRAVVALDGRASSAIPDPDKFLVVLDVTGGLSIVMRIMFWGGIIISLPAVMWAVADFVFPGLRRKERKAIVGSLGFAAGLFVAGVAMGYFVALPAALNVMFSVNEWVGVTCPFMGVLEYVTFVLQLLLCFGIAFELPVLLVALGAIGVVSAAMLRKGRRHAIVILMVAAMVLTPGTDAVSMLILAVPLMLLYEVSIWILSVRERKHAG